MHNHVQMPPRVFRRGLLVLSGVCLCQKPIGMCLSSDLFPIIVLICFIHIWIPYNLWMHLAITYNFLPDYLQSIRELEPQNCRGKIFNLKSLVCNSHAVEFMHRHTSLYIWNKLKSWSCPVSESLFSLLSFGLKRSDMPFLNEL